MPHSKKFELTRLPPLALRVLADVMKEDGDVKYKRWDWVDNKSSQEDLDAALRHLSKVQVGEWLDPDSGRPHVAHAALRLLMILERDELGAAHNFDLAPWTGKDIAEGEEPSGESEPDPGMAQEKLPVWPPSRT